MEETVNIIIINSQRNFQISHFKYLFLGVALFFETKHDLKSNTVLKLYQMANKYVI